MCECEYSEWPAIRSIATTALRIVLIMANDEDTSKNFRDGRSLEQTPGTVEVEVAMWIISTVQKLCFVILCHEE